MSDQANSTDEKPAKKTPGLTAPQVLQFIRENFVLVSAGTVLVGVVLSTTFLASYLSVFDWHLIFFVQYTDVITVGPGAGQRLGVSGIGGVGDLL
jgi:hypothetical protein